MRILGQLVTTRSISAVLDGKPVSIASSHPEWDRAVEIFTSEDPDIYADEILKMIEPLKEIGEKLSENISIHHGQVTYKGEELHHVLAEKLLADYNAGYNLTAFVNFVENLMQNPSYTSISELYLFLEAANLPLTKDGCFLAYKRIRNNYTDIHSGKFDNSPGQVLSMPRHKVDDNRNRTCSYGFHFCSYPYLSQFGSSQSSTDRVVIVKINPKDVVTIPSDYQNTKGRATGYTIVSEIEDWQKGFPDVLTNNSADEWEDFEDDYEEEDWDDCCHNCGELEIECDCLTWGGVSFNVPKSS